MRNNSLQRAQWHGGQLLAFSGLDGPTDFAQGLVARTSPKGPGLEVVLPAACSMRFPHPVATPNTVAGDWFTVGAGAGAVRGAFLDTHHLLLDGPCEVVRADAGIATHRAGTRTLVGVAAHFDATRINTDLGAAQAARVLWLASVPLPPALRPAARRTLLKSLAVLKTQVYTPEGRIQHRWTTPDRWPHRRMWLWDSAFHAIGWRHVAPDLARDAISAVLDMQTADGFVAHMMDPAGTSRITQPPVLALATKLVFDAAPAPDWLAAVYPKLVAYVEWDLMHRDSDGAGLVEWQIDGDPRCRSGESGMDNSPRFDAATRMDATDFNAFLAHECELLAGFATTLGRSADAARWRARHARLCALIRERLWSEELGFFVDYDLERKAQSPVLASSGFLPLICGAATPAQTDRLAAHLRDPAMFGTACPVASIAAKDTAHYQKDMWRGPVWVNVNWLIAYGFARAGRPDVAAQLRAQTVAEIERTCEEFGVLFEFFDDRRELPPTKLLRKGKCAPEEHHFLQVFHDYGWTASLYVDMMYGGEASP